MKVRHLKNRNNFSTLDKRCPDFMWGCPSCNAWRFFDENHRFARSYQEVTMWADARETEEAQFASYANPPVRRSAA
jgi:hypothetical protein